MSEFKLLSEELYPEPREVTLPDGRMYRVYGIRTYHSYLTRSDFESALAEWRLAGKWMPRMMTFNTKAAIDLAAYMREQEFDPSDPPAWALGCDPERCEECGSLLYEQGEDIVCPACDK